MLKRGDIRKPGEKRRTPGRCHYCRSFRASSACRSRVTRRASCRAALAKWLTDANNPLSWRVMVNRVWQWHFGTGLVGTANDFGKMGQLPTHPELLDFPRKDELANSGSQQRERFA